MRRPKVMRRLDWSFPPPPVTDRELVEVRPDEPTDRPPILFVHGLGHAAWCWREHWMPAAAERGWPTYAVSLRGHGSSGGADHLRAAPLRWFEHDVLQAITRLPEPPVIVGHSMGGLVVQRVLERYPARAGVLVASIDPLSASELMGVVGSRWPLQLARAMVTLPLQLQPDMLFSDRMDPAATRALTARTEPESAVATLELTLPHRRYETDAPMVVLGAGADRLVPPVHAVRLARHYGTRAHLFAGMGHDLMLDAGWEAPLDVMLDGLEEILS